MRERPDLLLLAARSRDPSKRVVTCAQAAAALGMSLDRFDREIRGDGPDAGVGLRPRAMRAGRPVYDAAYLHARLTELGLWGWRAREDAAREAAREAAEADKEEARRARAEAAAAKRGAREAAAAARRGSPGDVPGEIAAAVFALFDEGADPVRIVVEARCAPAAVEDLRRRYDAMRGGVTLSAADLAALRAAGVRVDAADPAAAVASIVAATRCARCRGARATICRGCLAEVEAIAAAAPIRETPERRAG